LRSIRTCRPIPDATWIPGNLLSGKHKSPICRCRLHQFSSSHADSHLMQLFTKRNKKIRIFLAKYPLHFIGSLADGANPHNLVPEPSKVNTPGWFTPLPLSLSPGPDQFRIYSNLSLYSNLSFFIPTYPSLSIPTYSNCSTLFQFLGPENPGRPNSLQSQFLFQHFRREADQCFSPDPGPRF